MEMISGDEVDSCTVNLLLGSEFEVKLHVPSGYPRHNGCFWIKSDSIIQAWTKEVNEFLLDPGVKKLSICDVLDKSVELFSLHNLDKKEFSFQDEADIDESLSSEKEEEDIMCDISDDDDNNTFTTDWELKITRKKTQWALKEAFFRQMMKKKRTGQVTGAKSKTARQVFTSTAASGILTNDLVKIMECEKTCGFSADTIEDNIFHWQVRLNKFDPDSDLTQDLQYLQQKYGYDYIEMEMTFEIDLYPFYPPLVKVLRPRLKNSMMQRITNIEFLQLSYWSPTRDMMSVIDGIKDFLQQNARIDLNVDTNNLSRCLYQNIEHHLFTLAQVSEVVPRASYQSLLDKDRLKELKDTATHLKSHTVIANGTDQYRCWAKGTGYGHDSMPDWDFNAFIASQRERDNQIESSLTEILKELKTFPVSLPLNTGDIVLPSLDAVGCASDEWEQSYDVAGSNCRMNAGMSDQDFMNDMFIALEGSALVPFIEQLLKVDSFLEISQHSVVYTLIVNILQEICYRRELLPLLCSLPSQTMSIYKHLEHFNVVPSKMLNQIRKPTNGHVINQGLDDEGSGSSGDDDIAVNCLDTFTRMRGKNRLTKISNPCLIDGVANQLTADEKLARGFLDVFNNITRCLEDTNLIGTCQNSPVEVATGDDTEVDHCKADAAIETVYNESMKKFLFKTCEISVKGRKCHHFADAFSHQQYQTCKTQVIRIAQEHLSLSTSLPLDLSSAVFVRCDEEKISLMQALITGPSGTPYSSGCFLFDIFFTNNYPTEPPKVHLITTGNNKVRFNPNLYNCGKVCLSLLGTWHGQNGEKWNEKTSTILQVLVSIQSLILVPDPYFNEPGYEKIINTDEGTRLSEEYNKDIQLNCIKYAMIDQLVHPPPGFEDVIRMHFFLKKDLILEEVQEWCKSSKCSQMEVAVNSLRKELMKLTLPISAQEKH